MSFVRHRTYRKRKIPHGKHVNHADVTLAQCGTYQHNVTTACCMAMDGNERKTLMLVLMTRALCPSTSCAFVPGSGVFSRSLGVYDEDTLEEFFSLVGPQKRKLFAISSRNFFLHLYGIGCRTSFYRGQKASHGISSLSGPNGSVSQ